MRGVDGARQAQGGRNRAGQRRDRRGGPARGADRQAAWRERRSLRPAAISRRCASAAELGADATIPLVEDEAALDASFAAAFEKGVDVVVDYLWGKSAERLLIAAAKAGKAAPLRFVQIGVDQRRLDRAAERRPALGADHADGQRPRQRAARPPARRHRRGARSGRVRRRQDRGQSRSVVRSRTGMGGRRQRPSHRVHDGRAAIDGANRTS